MGSHGGIRTVGSFVEAGEGYGIMPGGEEGSLGAEMHAPGLGKEIKAGELRDRTGKEGVGLMGRVRGRVIRAWDGGWIAWNRR